MRQFVVVLVVGGLCSGSIAMAEGFGFASFSAAVKANGTTARSSGVKQSLRFAKGRYIVEFTRAVKTCTYVASPNGRTGGQASITLSAANNRSLEIRTYSKTGAVADLDFAIIVSCSS